RRLICSLGRLERYKGHHRLIAALPELHRRDPSIRLVLLGTGDYRTRLESQVDRLGLRHLVEFRSSAIDRREEISTLLAQASLVVSLSEYESQGVAVLEALAVGSPVLVNDSTAFRQLGAAGLVSVVPPNCSSHALAEIVLHCLQEESVVPPQVPPTWEATTDALEALYELVVQRARRNRERRRRLSVLASTVRHTAAARR
ncbi:MAG: glycosyltransferase, partial [Actinomycetota bacterium]|nr:glycosyltransferase [Actinomycetota bacterium]